MIRVTGLMALLTCVLGLGGCEPAVSPVQPRQRTYFHFLHAHAGAGPLDVELETYDEKRTVASRLQFGTSWPAGGYASLLVDATSDTVIKPGDIQLRLLSHPDREEVVSPRQLELRAEKYASYCLIDSFGKSLLIWAVDNFEVPPAGRCNVRFMNLCSYYRSVTLESKDDTLQISRMAFLNLSSFKTYTTGYRTFYFINDLAGALIDSVNVVLSPGKTYNLYLTQSDGEAYAGWEVLE
ncbi:MAG: hypothetical protein SF053_07215 [Bacteroidia bacterium]|nr:hypothetical protein [Bacteroidia bacterium]